MVGKLSNPPLEPMPAPPLRSGRAITIAQPTKPSQKHHQKYFLFEWPFFNSNGIKLLGNKPSQGQSNSAHQQNIQHCNIILSVFFKKKVENLCLNPKKAQTSTFNYIYIVKLFLQKNFHKNQNFCGNYQ
jgi:hypothetical protein